MTIYSQHATRGKVQIQATYDGERGVVSSTVTSVGSPALAEPIVDALNRISALATVPLSIYDRRGGRLAHYPTGHLAALTDKSSRDGLLVGEHSFWYEYVRLELHRALDDLEKSTSAAPEPVQFAIRAELETEERQLREALAEYSEGAQLPEVSDRRYWDSGRPFVRYEGGGGVLSNNTRMYLDGLESGITAQERRRAVEDLRVLVTAYGNCSGAGLHVDEEYPGIFAEPYAEHPYFVTIDAPRPGGEGERFWEVAVCRWVPDDPDDEFSEATGHVVRRCELSLRPSAADITDLLDQAGRDPELIAEWAETEIGESLAKTDFVVTGIGEH